MTQPRSNSRRFVSAAWSLLTFQLIASAGAVAVTGYAAFHVRDLVSGAQQMNGPVEAAVPAPEATAEAPAAATPAPEAAATAPAVIEVPADPASPAPAPAVPINEGTGTLRLNGDDRGGIIATLTDPDGLGTRPQIYWFRNGVHVPAANNATTYAIRYEDSQASITARADYVDGHGFRESVMSAPYQVGAIIQ